MSRINNNSTQRRWGQPAPPPGGFWWLQEGSVAQGSFTSYSNRVVRQMFYTNPFSNYFLGSGSLPERRIVAGPLSAFPSFLLPILDEVMPRDTLSSPRHSTPAPTLEFIRDRSNDPKLPQDEQNKVLKKLRREIFNPEPKRLTKRVCQYYKDGIMKSSLDNKARQDDDEDEKRCVICLDDFEAKQVVMTTPCDHMFHEDCIVPWVKSHGHCPICRSTI